MFTSLKGSLHTGVFYVLSTSRLGLLHNKFRQCCDGLKIFDRQVRRCHLDGEGLFDPGRQAHDGERIEHLTTPEIVSRGLTMVPENRRLFGKMTVKENLEIGANLREDKAEIQEDIERVFSLFPRLKERIRQRAGTLSGGEQQMLAIGRALTARPKVLLLDEPSMGLAPILVEQVFETIEEINSQGTTIFVVEQNAHMALSIADRGYVLQTGSIVLEDTAENLLEHPQLSDAYLGEME